MATREPHLAWTSRHTGQLDHIAWSYLLAIPHADQQQLVSVPSNVLLLSLCLLCICNFTLDAKTITIVLFVFCSQMNFCCSSLVCSSAISCCLCLMFLYFLLKFGLLKLPFNFTLFSLLFSCSRSFLRSSGSISLTCSSVNSVPPQQGIVQSRPLPT